MSGGKARADVEAHVRLGMPVARRLARSWASHSRRIDRNDLHGEASLALAEAAQAFDRDRGVPFEAFAFISIDFALRKRIAAADGWRRKPRTGGAAALAEGPVDDGDFFQESSAEVGRRIEEHLEDYAMAMALDMFGREPVASPEEQVGRQRTREALCTALSRLEPRDLELLRCLHEDECTLDGAARAFGTNVSMTFRKQRTLLQGLRKHLVEKGVHTMAPVGHGESSIFADAAAIATARRGAP